MKYMLLAYTNEADWAAVDYTSAEFQEWCAFYEDLGKELTATGEFVSTEGLADPSFTRTTRKQGDTVVATDGPYAEFKEVLVSFSIIDCAGIDRAMEIAARITAAVGDTIEVRPVMDGGPTDAPL
jgi:hypothetical protein